MRELVEVVWRNCFFVMTGYCCMYVCVFQDNTLKIQARKTQYMCMSKLTAKELANRGHQFLANGDKRKSTSHTAAKDKAMVQNGEGAGKGSLPI